MKKIDDIKFSNSDLIRVLYRYIQPYRLKFFIGTVVRLCSDLVNLYPAIAIASVFTFLSKYQPGSSTRELWLYIGLFSVAIIVRIVGNHSSKYLIYQVSEKCQVDSQLKVINHLFKLNILWHEKENSGNKLKKIQRGGSGIDRIIRMWVNNYIEILVSFVGIIFILSRISLVITGLSSFFMVTYFIISFLMLKRAAKIIQTVNNQEEEINGLIFQAINNIRSVKISNMSNKIMVMLDAQMSDMLIWIKKRIISFQLRGTILAFYMYFFRIAGTAYIAFSITRGENDIGFLILFNMYFMRIAESVSELADISQDVIVNKLGIARMEAILNENQISSSGENKKFPNNWKKISINNLSFSYGSKKVLSNLSFEIKRGEKIGIVGLSGAGKSTLFKLLLREIEEYEGEIKIDNLSLLSIDRDEYCNNVGVVLQDTEVFNFSLRENITIASEKNKDRKKLAQAMHISHVDDFVHRLPNGIDTFIGEKGVKLSGGERQRLGIARAIYKQPQILFLDEATSHLDLESEEKIKESLNSFFQKVTAVVIAHRLTTIREMDKIILIEDGQIVEIGSFEQLQAKRGRFYELWQKQQL